MKKSYFYNGVPVELGSNYNIIFEEDGAKTHFWGNNLDERTADMLVRRGILTVKEVDDRPTKDEVVKRLVDVVDTQYSDAEDVFSDMMGALALIDKFYPFKVLLKEYSKLLTKGINNFPREVVVINSSIGVPYLSKAGSIDDVKNVAWFNSFEDADFVMEQLKEEAEEAFGDE